MNVLRGKKLMLQAVFPQASCSHKWNCKPRGKTSLSSISASNLFSTKQNPSPHGEVKIQAGRIQIQMENISKVSNYLTIWLICSYTSQA